MEAANFICLVSISIAIFSSGDVCGKKLKWSSSKIKRQEESPSYNPPVPGGCVWKEHPDYVLAFHNYHVLHTPSRSNEECKEQCINGEFGFECKSFEHVPQAKYDCVLSNDTQETAIFLYQRENKLEYVPGAIYTELQCGGDQGLSVTPTCPSGWILVGERCLVVVNDTITYDEAKYQCEEQFDAKLASIHSEAEYLLINEELSITGVNQLWIGLLNPEGDTLNWDDGTEYNFHPEYVVMDDGGETLTREEKCMRQVYNYIGQTGWIDGKCSKQICYVCARSADKEK